MKMSNKPQNYFHEINVCVINKIIIFHFLLIKVIVYSGHYQNPLSDIKGLLCSLATSFVSFQNRQNITTNVVHLPSVFLGPRSPAISCAKA